MSQPTFKFDDNQSEQAYERVLPVDLEKLKLVKITNFNKKTTIVGTNSQSIRIRFVKDGDSGQIPLIDVKENESEIEIAAGQGRNWNFISSTISDRFGQEQTSFEGVEAPVEPFPSDFSENEAGREAYKRAREEYKEKRKHLREQFKGDQHQVKEQLKEVTKQVKEQVKAGSRDGAFWEKFDFNSELIGEIASSIGKTVSGLAGSGGDLYIEVPSGVNLEVKSASGKASITNISGFVRIKNASGGIKLQNLTGGLQLNGASGQVEALGLAGEIKAKVISGSISFQDCHPSSLDLVNTSGSIDLEIASSDTGPGDFKITSTSGRISLLVPVTTRASVECRSLSGRIDADRELGRIDYRTRPGQNQARLELNGGGRRVSLNTISGGIRIGVLTLTEQSNTPADSSGWPTPAQPNQGFERVSASNFNSQDSVYAKSREQMNQSGKNYVDPSFEVKHDPGFKAPFSTPLITPEPRSDWPEVERAGGNPSENNFTFGAELSLKKDNLSESEIKIRQLEILKKIERGELSVEEGLSRLKEFEVG